MKKLFLFILLCNAFTAFSQIPIDERSIWLYEYFPESRGYCVSYNYYGTAERNGRTYQNLIQGFGFYNGTRHRISHAGPYEIPLLGVRVEGNRWLVDYNQYLEYMDKLNSFFTVPHEWAAEDYLPYEVTDDGEMVLYDFGMQVGDKFRSVPGHEDISVVKTAVLRDEYVYEGDYLLRKVLLLSNGLVLVEGVGCINSMGGLLAYLNPGADERDKNDYMRLDRYDCGISEWYRTHTQEAIGLVADESLDIESTDVVHFQSHEGFFDLQGRRVANPQKGIYIRNGKKVVVK